MRALVREEDRSACHSILFPSSTNIKGLFFFQKHPPNGRIARISTAAFSSVWEFVFFASPLFSLFFCLIFIRCYHCAKVCICGAFQLDQHPTVIDHVVNTRKINAHGADDAVETLLDLQLSSLFCVGGGPSLCKRGGCPLTGLVK